MISELNGWPGRSSVNASPILSRESAHDSKPNWFAIPSFAQNFHLLLSSGFYRRFPGHLSALRQVQPGRHFPTDVRIGFMTEKPVHSLGGLLMEQFGIAAADLV